MAQKKYLSLERLAEYDALLKAKMATDDASTLESAKEYADELVEGVNTAITSGNIVVKEAEHAVSADSAVKATQDANGNVITETYETKTDAASKLEEAKEYTDTKFDGHTHSWNDLTDKPFGEEGGSGTTTYEWDGKWSSLTDVDMTLCKVSDTTPTPEELIGAKFVIKHYLNGVIDEIVVDNSHIMYDAEVGGVQIRSGADLLAFVMYENNTMNMEKGIHLPVMSARPEDSYVIEYVASITVNGSSSIKTLDEKFIPDTIARVETLHTVASTGSWNDLEDKPFGEEGDGFYAEWDGNVADAILYSNDNIICKVSDVTPSAAELVGAEIKISRRNEIEKYTLTEANIIDYSTQGGIIAIYNGNQSNGEAWAVVAYEGNISNLEPGTYLYAIGKGYIYEKYESYVTYIAVDYRFKAIDEKFIPETIARVSYVDELAVSVDTNRWWIDNLKDKVNNLGTLATKDIVSESDLDTALAAKVNAAAEGNHSHSNKDVLDGITSAKVNAWDTAKDEAIEAATTKANAAESAAKTYADGLDSAMGIRVSSLEDWHKNFEECTQADIQGLFNA